MQNFIVIHIKFFGPKTDAELKDLYIYLSFIDADHRNQWKSIFYDAYKPNLC
jgi:hypothetical protein